MPDPVSLLRLLARRGPSSGPELAAALGVSQPTFSRLARACGDALLVVGRARRTRYAARRPVAGVDAPVPVFEVGRPGEPPRRLVTLHPTAPDGFWVEAHHPDAAEGFHDDLPWFLGDLRPAGFLGRLVPRRHPGEGWPPDVLRWRADHVLQWATRWAWNAPGALIAGDAAFRRFLDEQVAPSDAVRAEDRAERYPALAADVLAWGPTGSSAGGERPKLLATRVDGAQRTPVLVKFSPPGDDPVSRRTADLLVAEHLALEVLRDHGQRAACSEILVAGGRTFLEVVRFDRHGTAHRTGQISLVWADAALVGTPGLRWLPAVEALVGADAARATRWLEAFGRWIGNTDMHPANLSLELRGTTPSGLAPAYDVSPAAWAPRAGELVEVDFRPERPDPADAAVAREAWAAARDLWHRVSVEPRISRGFRSIAAECGRRVAALEPLLDLLPTGGGSR